MSELAATDQSPVKPPNAVDDLEGWIANKEKELASDVETEPEAQPAVAAEPVPAAPAVAAPATPTPEEKKVSWRELPLDDVDDAFLRGKPAAELEKSYKASVAAMQKAQREANEAKSELQRLRAEAEARTAPAIPPADAAPAVDTEGEEIDRLLFEDTPAGRKKLEARIEERARAIAREEFDRSTQASDAQRFNEAMTTASIAATQRVAKEYGWTEDEAVVRMKSTFPVIKDYVPQYGPQILINPEVYYGAIHRLYGPPPQAAPAAEAAPPEPVAVTPPPVVVPNPPGGGRPAPVVTTPKKTGSPLSRELQDARRVVAEQMRAAGHDIDVDAFASGTKRNGAKNA